MQLLFITRYKEQMFSTLCRAMAEIKKHVHRHMKVGEEERIWIDEEVNQAVWARGMQKPPRKIKVICTREEGFPIEVKLLE